MAGPKGQAILSSRAVGERGKRHVIPACGSQGKGELRQRKQGPKLSCGGAKGLCPTPPPHGSSPGPPGGPRPQPISGERVRLSALPDSSNESHIHSVLLAYCKPSLCLWVCSEQLVCRSQWMVLRPPPTPSSEEEASHSCPFPGKAGGVMTGSAINSFLPAGSCRHRPPAGWEAR